MDTELYGASERFPALSPQFRQKSESLEWRLLNPTQTFSKMDRWKMPSTVPDCPISTAIPHYRYKLIGVKERYLLEESAS